MLLPTVLSGIFRCNLLAFFWELSRETLFFRINTGSTETLEIHAQRKQQWKTTRELSLYKKADESRRAKVTEESHTKNDRSIPNAEILCHLGRKVESRCDTRKLHALTNIHHTWVSHSIASLFGHLWLNSQWLQSFGMKCLSDFLIVITFCLSSHSLKFIGKRFCLPINCQSIEHMPPSSQSPALRSSSSEFAWRRI
jgi:hypothetical protein